MQMYAYCTKCKLRINPCWVTKIQPRSNGRTAAEADAEDGEEWEADDEEAEEEEPQTEEAAAQAAAAEEAAAEAAAPVEPITAVPGGSGGEGAGDLQQDLNLVMQRGMIFPNLPPEVMQVLPVGADTTRFIEVRQPAAMAAAVSSAWCGVSDVHMAAPSCHTLNQYR